MNNLTSEEIRVLRGTLSRRLFGLVMCVDEDTIRRWESGELKPNGSRQRLMNILAENEEIYKKIAEEESREKVH